VSRGTPQAAPQRNNETVAHLMELEQERCRAISEGDWEALANLLSDDFTYGFLSGRIEDKREYLAGIPTRPHSVSRSGLEVRVYDRAAVMTGEFVTMDTGTGETLNAGTCLQCWILGEADSGWRLVALSTTRFGPRSTHWSTTPGAEAGGAEAGGAEAGPGAPPAAAQLPS
jgi:hypothetical protein